MNSVVRPTTDISVVDISTEFVTHGRTLVAWGLLVVNSVVSPNTELDRQSGAGASRAPADHAYSIISKRKNSPK